MEASVSQSMYRSSVELFPSVPRPVAVRDRHAPNYALRRGVAAAASVTLVLFVAIAISLLAGLGGRPASAFQAVPATSPATVVAEPGDSLWSIAEDHHGTVEIGRYVDALISTNGGTAIQAGQAVRLP
jgi:LysM repeat protein